MNNFDYKNMTPFKWFVLENFPFIENDFEAINNYRLFSKVVEYLNKTIDNVNELGQLVEEFSNYFDNLDVQEEINNKLDELVKDGTLTNLIETYINPYLQKQDKKINEIDLKVTNIASGSPLVVSSVSEMEDINRIYVNTTDGNWYYYNGEEWTIGGVYQATGISKNDPIIIDLYDLHEQTIDLLDVLNKGYYKNNFQNNDYGYLDINGNINGAGYQNSVHTDLIPIVPIIGTKITCKSNAINSTSVIAFFDKDKNFLSSIIGKYLNAYTTDTYSIILDETYANARYVAFSTYFTNENQLISNNYEINYNNEKTTFSLLDSFLKIGVAGDSLSVGWMQDENGVMHDRNINYSWIQYFARSHGITGLNFGQSGANCKNWIEHYNCYPLALKPENKCQAYIIGLGVNDNANVYSNGWGSISDIKENYTNNIDSFIGTYGGIIQRLKEINPKAIFFCLSTVGARESIEKNNYIKSICDYFGKENNVHYIDITAFDNIFNSSYMENLYVGGHYEAVGYNICSQVIDKAISEYMYLNSEYFKYTGFIEM